MKKKANIYVLLMIEVLIILMLSTTAYATSEVTSVSDTNTGSDEIVSQSDLQHTAANTSATDDEDAPNLVQAVTCGGIIITAILGIANLITSVRQIHIDGVSNKRVQWIDSVREITANIVCYDLRKVEDDEQFETEYNEFVKNAYKLSLYLNIQGPFDRVVSDYLIEFVKSQRMKSDDFAHNRRMLNLAVQIYLKSEWNRVKHESKIITFKKYSEKESIANILGTLKGGYVDKLRQRYEKYLNGGEMDAPVFFEFIELKFKEPIRF